MLFNSYLFVFAFFPIVLLGYFGLNRFKQYGAAKVLLIAASLFFYGYYNWYYLIIIVASIVLNYLFSLILLSDKQGRGVKRAVFALALTLNIGSLVAFKYLDFFITNVNGIFATSMPLLHIALPLGISFFTFQQLSYVIDSYKKDVPKYNFFDYALFVTYFPQLIAGPIVTHDEMVPQFADVSKKKFNSDHFFCGLYGFALGLGKKVIIADTFGLFVDAGFADVSSLGTTNAILVMLAYTFQIYFDFSGYCDMAMGIGKMMNLEIAQNFNSPYRATNILDFWKRWHMTLTRFFTRYIYIPLGGNRNGLARACVNVMIVYLVSGIWHGANWTFIVWGLAHGVASVITRLIDAKTGIFTKNNSKVLKVVFWFGTFLFVNLAWVIFRAESLTQTVEFYQQLFSFNFVAIKNDLVSTMWLDGIKLICYPIPVLGDLIIHWFPYMLFGFALMASVFFKNASNQMLNYKSVWYKPFLTAVILFWCIMSFAGVSSFLYWNF